MVKLLTAAPYSNVFLLFYIIVQSVIAVVPSGSDCRQTVPCQYAAQKKTK